MRILLATILVLMFAGCKSFENSIKGSIGLGLSYIHPDTCDIKLIKDLAEYRLENKMLPDSQMIRSIHANLDETCYSSIDSIRSLNYNHDSLDMVIMKNFPDTTLKVNSAMKGYRLIFETDTLRAIRLLHSDSDLKSELWPSQN